MRDGLGMIAIGGVIGVVIAMLSASLLRSALYGVQPIDPITFTAGPLLLLAVGALAAWVPARRAPRGDPARGLKGE